MRRRNVDHQALPIARDVIGGGDKGHRLCERHAQPPEIGGSEPVPFSYLEDAVDVFHAESRYSKEQLARRAIDVDGKERAMAECPVELGVSVQGEIGFGGACELLHAKAVKSNEPVRLIKPVLADEGWGDEGEV